jgi:hypothetical protein
MSKLGSGGHIMGSLDEHKYIKNYYHNLKYNMRGQTRAKLKFRTNPSKYIKIMIIKKSCSGSQIDQS